MRQGVLPASALHGEKGVHCPDCNNRTLGVEGYYRRPYKSVFVNGAQANLELETEIEQTIDAIVCSPCQIRWTIESNEVFERSYENVNLHMQLATARGVTVVPASKKPVVM